MPLVALEMTLRRRQWLCCASSSRKKTARQQHSRNIACNRCRGYRAREVALPRLQAAPADRPIDLCSDGGVLSFLEQIARYITAESYADRADALKLWLDRIQCTGQDDPAFKRSEAVQLAEIFLQTAPPFSEFQHLGPFSRKRKMVACSGRRWRRSAGTPVRLPRP